MSSQCAVGASQSAGTDLRRNQRGPSFLAEFSSRGPTSDGRTKPEVVAPGFFLLSAGARPGQVGECDSAFTPAAGENSGGLLSIAGTSMATPVVSGMAALIRQYFEEGWYPLGRTGSSDPMSPSGALIKAVILNGASADVMTGVDNGSIGVTPVSAYDNNIGFGRVDLSSSLYIEGKTSVLALVWDRQEIADGEVREFSVTVEKANNCASEVLSATLVWVERGSVVGCTRCLLNDLDLHVTRNGVDTVRYFPNGLSRPDNVNTAERVLIPDANNGDTFTLHVTATNLNSPTQRFALVTTGCFANVTSSGIKSSEPTDPEPDSPPTPIDPKPGSSPTPIDPKPGSPPTSNGSKTFAGWFWLLCYLFYGNLPQL